MPFCPVCRDEYVPGITRCPDCNAKLVAELPEERSKEERYKIEQIVTVAAFSFPHEAEIAKLKLESEGIYAVISNEIIARLDGPVFETYPVKVQVRETDARRAARIVAQLR